MNDSSAEQEEQRRRFIEMLEGMILLSNKIDEDTPSNPGQQEGPLWWRDMVSLRRTALGMLHQHS